MAVSQELDTFEEKLHQVLLAQLQGWVASVDVHHTRRSPCWVRLCCKETKKKECRYGCVVSDSFDQRRLEVHGVG